MSYSPSDRLKGTVYSVDGKQITLTINEISYASVYNTPVVIYNSTGDLEGTQVESLTTNPSFFINNPMINPLANSIVIKSGTAYLFANTEQIAVAEIRNLIGGIVGMVIATSFPFSIQTPANPSFPFNPLSFSFYTGVALAQGSNICIQFQTGQETNWWMNSNLSSDWVGQFYGYTLPYKRGIIIINQG